ncbi:MAG: radical SAM protein, partial [Chloroflexi bacterium]
PVETLGEVPELDTIVRFEGEFTLLELVQHLDDPDSWEAIQGLAFRKNGQVICTPPRPLIADLDSLPPIDYGRPRLTGKNLKSLPVLASRGCLFNCAFCSIRQFYGGAPGPLRRSRSPEHFVDELRSLYEKDGVRIFLFQDDDFAARTKNQRQWLETFLQAMDRAGLSGKVAWKISCRVDDLESQILSDCQARGLAMVYLGVESGSKMGLRTLNKHVSVDQNLAAIEMLKQANLAIGIGFMMFDPSTTFETIRENIAFLRTAAGNGAFPINFCKMLPYAGTPIEEALRQQGRLTGSLAHPDYNFTDPDVDVYALLVHQIFARRNFSSLGLANRLELAQINLAWNRTLGIDPCREEDTQILRKIVARSNKAALDVLEALIPAAMGDKNGQAAMDLANQEWECEAACINELDDLLFKTNPDLLRHFLQAIHVREKQLQQADGRDS